MSLIGKQAPEFVAKAILHGHEIDQEFSLTDLKGHYVLFFFYPLDFTFVCPTELHAFQERLHDFEERNCKVVGCSVDSHYSHLAWLKSPKCEGGIEGITYPLVSDITKEIAKSYDVLNESEGIAYRGTFLLDKEGIVRHQLINDLFMGRSTDEAIRILDALIFFEKHGEVCPANWAKGKKGMEADAAGVRKYFGKAT